MGLTVSRKTAKNLAVKRKNERILTVSRKKMLTVKKIQPINKVSRSFVDSDVLCVYVLWESPGYWEQQINVVIGGENYNRNGKCRKCLHNLSHGVVARVDSSTISRLSAFFHPDWLRWLY